MDHIEDDWRLAVTTTPIGAVVSEPFGTLVPNLL